MAPTVRSGDRLLVAPARASGAVRRATSSSPGSRPGPTCSWSSACAARFPAGHWVEGDNPLVTDDSRAFGTAVVVGRVGCGPGCVAPAGGG